MSKCKDCGSPVNEGHSFCPKCGSSLKKEEHPEARDREHIILAGLLVASLIFVSICILGAAAYLILNPIQNPVATTTSTSTTSTTTSTTITIVTTIPSTIPTTVKASTSLSTTTTLGVLADCGKKYCVLESISGACSSYGAITQVCKDENSLIYCNNKEVHPCGSGTTCITTASGGHCR